MLKKQIRKSLVETKEKKERRLMEEKLVESRLSVIVENIKSEKHFNQLSEEKQLKLSVTLLSELSYLHNNGFILEEGLGDILKSLLGTHIFGNITQTIFEKVFNSLLSGLGMGDGFMKNAIISFLTSRPSDVIKAFNDCRIMTTLVSRAIVEGLVMSLQKDKGFGGTGWDLVRNTLGEAIEQSDFGKKIESGIAQTVCSVMGKYTSKAENVLQKVKPAVAGSQ